MGKKLVGRWLGLLAVDLLAVPDAERYAYGIAQRTGMPSEMFWYQLREWVRSGWLDTDYEVHKFPGGRHRKYYLITALGQQELTKITEQTQQNKEAAARIARRKTDWHPRSLDARP